MISPNATYSFKLTNRASIECTVALLPGLFESLEQAVRAGKNIQAFLSDQTTMIGTTGGFAELSVTETTPRYGMESFFKYVQTNPSRVTRITIQTALEENLNAFITLEPMFPNLGAGNKTIYLQDYIDLNSITKQKLSADLVSRGQDFILDDQMLVMINIQPESEMIIGLHLVPHGLRKDNNQG